jgi:hypothetical protein
LSHSAGKQSKAATRCKKLPTSDNKTATTPCEQAKAVKTDEFCLASKLEHHRMTDSCRLLPSSIFEQPRSVKNVTFIKKVGVPPKVRQFSPEFSSHFVDY